MGKFDKEWQERFQRFGRGYEADHKVSGWSESGLERRLSLFSHLLSEQNLPTSSRVLDAGCGAGTYVRFLAERGFHAVGMDYSRPSLQRALAADPQHNGRYLGGDAYRLPFLSETFELVVSIGTFQAMENPSQALKEMVRVLRPKGLVIVECLNGRELISQVKTFVERIKGIAPKVRTYPPEEVEGWLEACGVTLVKRKGVYLPPRQFTQLSTLLDLKLTNFMLNRVQIVSLWSAHAFLLVGRKAA